MTVTPVDPKYLDAVREGLDRAYKNAPLKRIDLDTARIAVFSDHHKGCGDQADDFRRCEHAYTTALGFYVEQDFELLVLGDAEELWEEKAEAVLRRYPYVLSLEAEFRSRAKGLERFWGNHDDLWSDADAVEDKLETPLGGPIEVREGLRIAVEGHETELFFAHGHQGTTDGDKYGGLARIPVRMFWRPFQRITGYSATTPASDYAMRAKHDRAMFEWARKREPGLVLIAGHTHRPIFASSTPAPPATRPISELEALLAAAREAGDRASAGDVRAELEYALTAERRPDEAVTVTPPCYFNTGCCSFPDGDVTGLEIAGGEIRLVRWPANLAELRPNADGGIASDERICARAKLQDILDAVSAPMEADARIEEHRVEAIE